MESKYEKAYRLANKKTGWIKTAISSLAADLEEFTGQPVSVSGPFGLRAAVYIGLGEKAITITPEFPDGQLKLYYDTGETTDEYAPDTIGGINGFNNKQARLPQKIEDIAALFHGKAVH